MSMQDPIADMLTRIRNAQQAKHVNLTLSSSKIKEQIARVLKEEGYILDYEIRKESNNSNSLSIELKYFKGRPVIESIKRVSRPGLRIYRPFKKLPSIPGFGIAILSTSKGVMSHIAAKAASVGGEVLCEVA